MPDSGNFTMRETDSMLEASETCRLGSLRYVARRQFQEHSRETHSPMKWRGSRNGSPYWLRRFRVAIFLRYFFKAFSKSRTIFPKLPYLFPLPQHRQFVPPELGGDFSAQPII